MTCRPLFATAIPPKESLDFVSFADQAMYLAHSVGGQQAVIQLLWRYRRPVDTDTLGRLLCLLAQGPLSRLIRPALLPFGRHQWVRASYLAPTLAAGGPPLPPEALDAWIDAQVELPLDPVSGPPWNFTFQFFTDGSTAVSLVVSHCIADGMATGLAVSDALRGLKGADCSPAPQAVGAASRLLGEFSRAIKDSPAAMRALFRLVRVARKPADLPDESSSSPVFTGASDGAVVFPSVFMRVPTPVWDAKARHMGGNRLTLLAALTASFGEALGRVRGGEVTLMIPVHKRGTWPENGANQVSLATLKVSVGELRGRLHALQRRLHVALLRIRREADPLEALLPLVPFLPKRAFSAASNRALSALSEMPVTFTHLGDWPADILRIDGNEADRFCFRGLERGVAARAIEARQGVATLLSAASREYLLLNFVAYQPGVVTEPHHLRALVGRLMSSFEIVGEAFDA